MSSFPKLILIDSKLGTQMCLVLQINSAWNVFIFPPSILTCCSSNFAVVEQMTSTAALIKLNACKSLRNYSIRDQWLLTQNPFQRLFYCFWQEPLSWVGKLWSFWNIAGSIKSCALERRNIWNPDLWFSALGTVLDACWLSTNYASVMGSCWEGIQPPNSLVCEHKINPELLPGRRQGQMSGRSCQNGTAAYV